MSTPVSLDTQKRIYELGKAVPKRSSRDIARELGVEKSTVLKYRNRNPEQKQTDPVNEQILHLRARIKDQEKSIRKLTEVVGEQREIRDQIRESVVACEPYKRVAYKVPPKPGSPVVPVLKLSDWQIGEVINPEETEGFGRFDWKTAEDRIFYITDKFIEWVTLMRNSYRIDQCRVWREGDLVSGNIHKELEITNEFPAPMAAIKAGHLLAEVTSRIAAHFSEVILEGVDADNHGRLNPKPQAKQKAHNNWCYISAQAAKDALAKHGNVEFRETPGMRYLADVVGQKFLIMHGDGIKSSLGIPYYGLERDRAREATKRMNTTKSFHYVSCGHFHVPALVAGNIIINGSLTGTTEFDHSCGRHAPPSQVAFLVHPKHGLFNLVPFVSE